MKIDEKDLNTAAESQTEQNDGALEQCQAEVQKWKDSFLRANADFENFKRRTEKEKSNWIQETRSEVLLDLLNVVDNFDRAFEQKDAGEANEQLNAWLQGFEMIHKALYDLLARYDVKPMADGMQFDPEFHDAISQVDSDEVESGQIVSVVQKGFLVKDKVLRAAKVVVAK